MGEGRYNGRHDPTLASFVIIGMLLIWTAVERSFGTVDPLTFQAGGLTMSAVLAAFAAGSMLRDQLTEGTMSLFVAVSCAIDSLGLMFLGVEDIRVLDTLCSLAVLAFMLVQVFRRNRLMAAASLVLFLAMNIPSVIHDSIIPNAMLAASGVVFAGYGVYGLWAARTGRLRWQDRGHVGEVDGPYERVVIVGFFLVAVCGLLTTFSEYDIPFYVAAVVLSSCALAVGMYGVCKGIILEGTFILFYSAGTLMFAVGSLLTGGFMVTDTMVSLVAALCGAMMLKRRQYIPGAAALLFGLLSLPGILFEPGLFWDLGAVPMSLILLVYSVSRWVYKESGRITVPISSADGPMRYPHYSDLGRLAISPTAGTFAMGTMCAVGAFATGTGLADTAGLSPVACDLLWTMTSLLVLAFAAMTMWSRLIVDSVQMLILGSLGLILSVADITGGTSGLAQADLFFIVGLATCALVYARRGQHLRAAAPAVVGIALVSQWFLGAGNGDALAAALLIAGALFTVTAAYKTHGICVSKKRHDLDCPRMAQTPGEYAHTLVSTVGVLSFAILSLVMGYYVMGGGSGLYFVKVVLSSVVLLFGFYALRHGIASEGLMMYTVAMVTFISSALHMAHIHEPEMLKLAAAFVFIPMAYRFARESDWVMCLVSVLMALMFGLEMFEEDVVYLEVVVAALKAVSCIAAVLSIVALETGWDPLRRSVGREHHGGHHGHGSRTVAASHMTLGLFIVWCGVNYVLVITGHHVDIDTYHWTRIMLCGFVMLFVPDLLSRGMLTEAMMSIYIAMSSMAFSVSVAVFGVPGPIPLEAVFAIGILVICAVLAMKRVWVLALIAFCTSVAYIYPVVTDTEESMVMAVTTLAAGVLLVAHSLLGMALGDHGDELMDRARSPVAATPGGDYPMLLASTVGMFTSSLLAMNLELFGDGTAYCVSGMFMAVAAAAPAVYALYNGRPGFCMHLLSVALSISCVYVTALVGAEPDGTVMMLAALLLLVSVAPQIAAGRVYLGVSAALSAVVVAAGVLTGLWEVIGAGLLVYAVTSLVWSMANWVSSESGRPFPLSRL